MFRYLNAARDFHPIDINVNVKIKWYDLSYYYRQWILKLSFLYLYFKRLKLCCNILNKTDMVDL